MVTPRAGRERAAPWHDRIMRTVSVLGSTGSIGRQTLEVARWRGYRVKGLAAHGNAALLLEQVREFDPEVVVLVDEAAAADLRAGLPPGVRLLSGTDALVEAAVIDVDTVVAAIPGSASLSPTAAALAAGRHVALASKEAMVMAGPLMNQLARAAGARITPVDSEHSALYQCLQGEDPEAVQQLVLTASGGPFRLAPEDLSRVTPEQALQHPNWQMGRKVTIDSATLFNKGLEVLEAHFLFDVPLAKVAVSIHPQSLVHGLVRFADGSLKAQIGPHDMRLPIQYAIEAPERPAVPLPPLPLTGSLEFFEPDHDRFPSLRLAYAAGAAGGLAPVYLNAADEVAVEAFLAGRLRFTEIPAVIAEVLEHTPAEPLAWEALGPADARARSLALEAAGRLSRTTA